MGFTTGSGKKISISQEALAKASAVFNNESDYNSQLPTPFSQIHDEPHLSVQNQDLYTTSNFELSSFSTFSTGSGKKVHIPQEKLDAARKLLSLDEDPMKTYSQLTIDSTCTKGIDSTAFVDSSACDGFSTGSGQKIQISTEKLDTARKLLFSNDCDVFSKKLENNASCSFLKDSSFSGFSTGSGKKVEISQEMLKKAKTVIDFDEDIQFDHAEEKFGGKRVLSQKSNRTSSCRKNRPAVVQSQSNVRPNHMQKNAFTSSYVENIDPNTPVSASSRVKVKKSRQSSTQMTMADICGTDLSIESAGLPLAKRIRVTRSACSPKERLDTITLKSFFDLHKHEMCSSVTDRRLASVKAIELGLCSRDCASFKVDGKSISVFQDRLLTLGADSRYCTVEWVQQHYRWIVWKLVSYQRRFPMQFAGVLQFDTVLHQLKSRYVREFINAERSSLKEIIDKDNFASRFMILCVASIQCECPFVSSGVCSGCIELTDGWYSLPAVVDSQLHQLISSKKIFEGQKLCIFDSQLIEDQESGDMKLKM
jgi:hypothetical protein